MTQIAVEPPMPALPTGVLGNPPAADVGAAEAFALAIQLALGVVTAPATVVPTNAEGSDTSDVAASDEEVVPAGETDPDPAAVLPVLTLLTTPAPMVLSAAATAPTAVDVPSVAAPQPAETPSAETRPTDVPPTNAVTEAPADTTEAAPAPAAPAAPASGQAVTPQAPAAPLAETPAPTPASRAVAGQVVPEVTKLFSNGEGVHRVTLELNPRALGEVRVVLTVRHGDVHVRLAAGSEAREALALSSHDLTRALEQIGVKDHKLTLAELPAVTPGAATQTHSDTSEQREQQASFTGRFDTEHHHSSRHSRMGDDSTATDGTDHEHGSRSRGDRSIHEVSHVPSRGGVDLRM